MEPFSPQDPVSKLLAKARPVEPRPNFTQNVLRAVRQSPQRMSLRERLAEWCASLSRPALAGVCAVAVAALLAFQAVRQKASVNDSPGLEVASSSTATEDALNTDAYLATTLDDMNQLSMLLAQNDAQAMTDTEVAMLVY